MKKAILYLLVLALMISLVPLNSMAEGYSATVIFTDGQKKLKRLLQTLMK
ncbi:MAG: hypothetical protein GXZ11_05945 [Tissierellia bacterium]|nr:hypothetical protein [Tissierellia bacterium]